MRTKAARLRSSAAVLRTKIRRCRWSLPATSLGCAAQAARFRMLADACEDEALPLRRSVLHASQRDEDGRSWESLPG